MPSTEPEITSESLWLLCEKQKMCIWKIHVCIWHCGWEGNSESHACRGTICHGCPIVVLDCITPKSTSVWSVKVCALKESSQFESFNFTTKNDDSQRWFQLPLAWDIFYLLASRLEQHWRGSCEVGPRFQLRWAVHPGLHPSSKRLPPGHAG